MAFVYLHSPKEEPEGRVWEEVVYLEGDPETQSQSGQGRGEASNAGAICLVPLWTVGAQPGRTENGSWIFPPGQVGPFANSRSLSGGGLPLGPSLSLHVCVSLCSGWEDFCGLGPPLSSNADPTVRACCGRGDSCGTVHRSCAETTVPTGGSTGHCKRFLHYLFLKLLFPFVVHER